MYIKILRRRTYLRGLILAIAALLTSCAAPRVAGVVRAPELAPQEVRHGFTRTVNAASYSGIAFDEWSLALEPESVREHTLLIYMNGSDLESETAAGTGDLREIKRSGVDESRVNVVIFTGGAHRWHSGEIPSNQCAVSVLRGGELVLLGDVGQRDMGNAGTLASFISIGMQAFPAEETSLILWDHGGGSVAGYGADENFDMSTLTLLELEYAFERAGLGERPLAILGFDACLMATVEMAVVAERYAKLLVASEGTEPGDGWDYGVLSRLADEETEDFAAAVCVAFFDYYGDGSSEELTLSVVRTSEAANVMGALGLLAERCIADMENGGADALLSLRRSVKSFGDGTPADESSDMIDILGFASALANSYPDEARMVTDSLRSAVFYSVYLTDREVGGLSAYHIYSGRGDVSRALAVYKSLSMSAEYTQYLTAFAENLGGASVSPHENALLLGESFPMFVLSRLRGRALFSVPAVVNGGRAEVLVLRRNGADELIGYRRRDGALVQKGYDEFSNGDTLELLRQRRDGWTAGAAHKYDGRWKIATKR